MHAKKLVLFTAFACLYSLCVATYNDTGNSTMSSVNTKAPEMHPANDSSNQQMNSNFGEIDAHQAMARCNESFQLSMNYLEEMNMTGSYPDETEKLPMCFMQCYMEALGILTPGNEILKENAMSYYSTNDNILNDCSKEIKEIDSLDPCEYAYFVARCIMMATLVDNRKTDT